jgi:tRNA 2-thiocytidine biosynthesis protein TtcA
MLRDWEKRFPGRIETLFRSLANVVPSHLMDAQLHDFRNLKATGVSDPAGDTAFDTEEFHTAGMVSWPAGVL